MIREPNPGLLPKSKKFTGLVVIVTLDVPIANDRYDYAGEFRIFLNPPGITIGIQNLSSSICLILQPITSKLDQFLS